jgi:hypothetical protein
MLILTVKSDKVELEESSIAFQPVDDPRPRMPEPPPVQLLAIKDMQVQCHAGSEVPMDDFYVKLLHFERDEAPPGHIIYRAENFRLCFEVVEPPKASDEVRPIGINVPSLPVLELQLMEREIPCEFHRGLLPGQEAILLQDPAGNWVQIGQFGLIR